MLFSKLGLLHLDKDKVFNGFTLIPIFRGQTVNLIDVEANIIHQWNLPGRLGSLAYLLPGGNLLCSLVTEKRLNYLRACEALILKYLGT
mgnify:CR=1 FL=1